MVVWSENGIFGSLKIGSNFDEKRLKLLLLKIEFGLKMGFNNI